MNRAIFFSLLFAYCFVAEAQTDYLRQAFSVGAGISVPNNWSHRFKKAPSVDVEYSYRIRRNFQVDVGVASVIDGWDTYELCRFGSTPVTNAGFIVPFGGRAVLPINDGRVLVSIGAGGAYLKYTSPCAAPRGVLDAWGGYGLGAVSVAIDKAKRFRVGVLTRYYRAYDRGYFQDAWANVYLQFAISF